MKNLPGLFFLATLLSPLSVFALVNPETTADPVADWYAQIYILGYSDGDMHPLCKGTLIDPSWVLTTTGCLQDPFKALNGDSTPGAGEIFLRFGNRTTIYEADALVTSFDTPLAMVHLKQPVDFPVLKVTYYSAGELEGTQVEILGNESSQAIGDTYYNQAIDDKMYCRINDSLFYDTTGKVFCYLVAPRQKSTTFLRQQATIVNPLTTSKSTDIIDQVNTYDPDGAYLRLSYDSRTAYPCLEDIGEAILAYDEANEPEVVGVVSGLGMVIGFPNCHGGLYNVNDDLGYGKAFIEKTLAGSYFDEACPATPVLEYEFTSDDRLRLHWEAIPGVEGYKIHFTSAEGVEPIETVDVGNVTEIEQDLLPEHDYEFAITSYIRKCSSPLSSRQRISLPAN